MQQITKEQLEDLEDTRQYGRRIDFHRLLEETTGIRAESYTAFQYYDAAGNFIGDSDNYTLSDLLENAYIEVVY
jgi:hypothetical protein